MSEIVAEAIGPKSVPQWLLDVYLPLVDEAKVHFNDDGIAVRAVDPANVAMHFVTLDQSAFEHWDSPGTVTVGANLNRFDEFLDIGTADTTRLAIDMETRKLHIDTAPVENTMALIDPDSVRQEPDLPDLDLPNTVALTGQQLDMAITAVENVSDHLEIHCDVDAETVAVVGEGDTDETRVTFEREDCADGTQIKETTVSKYSVNYLEKLVKPVPKDATVTIDIGNEHPIRWDWTAMDGCLDVTTMCAPRI